MTCLDPTPAVTQDPAGSLAWDPEYTEYLRWLASPVSCRALPAENASGPTRVTARAALTLFEPSMLITSRLPADQRNRKRPSTTKGAILHRSSVHARPSTSQHAEKVLAPFSSASSVIPEKSTGRSGLFVLSPGPVH